MLVMIGAACFAAPAQANCGDVLAQAEREGNGDVAVAVPYFFGLTRDRAQAMAADACLAVRFSGPGSNNATVVAQSLQTGRRVRPRSSITLRMALVDSTAVPSLTGLSHDAASIKADQSGLRTSFYGPIGPGSIVITQSRPAGQTIARGSFVQLQMGAAKAAAMPDFVGRTRAQAEALAAANRLDTAFSGSDDPDARIFNQSPLPGTRATPGMVVRLQLQLAVEQTTMPNLLNRTRAAALAIAQRRGLALSLVGDPSATARVSRQSPAPGTSLSPDARVQAVMSAAAPTAEATGPAASEPAAGETSAPPVSTGSGLQPGATTQVPDLAGMTRAEVQGYLATHRLIPNFLGDPAESAQVTSQAPAAGRTVREGTQVRIVMAKVAAARSSWPWIAGGGGALVLVAGAALLLRRKSAPGASATAARVEPSPSVADTPPPALTPVTYVASVDQGRPTLRLVSDPPVAARALVVEAPQGGRP